MVNGVNIIKTNTFKNRKKCKIYTLTHLILNRKFLEIIIVDVIFRLLLCMQVISVSN